MAVCLENLEQDLLNALGHTPDELSKMSQSELAKLLSQNPSVPEKGIWSWLSKAALVDAAHDVLNQPALYGHLLKAFQARVDTLNKRMIKALADGDNAKVNKLSKDLAAATDALEQAKVKYYIEPPPPPLVSAESLTNVQDLSVSQLAKMIGDLPEMPEGPTIYSWLGKEDLITALHDLAADSSVAQRNAILLKAYQARVNTLNARYNKAADKGDWVKANKLQNEVVAAQAKLVAKKQELGPSPLQTPDSAPVSTPSPTPSPAAFVDFTDLDSNFEAIAYQGLANPNKIKDLHNAWQFSPASDEALSVKGALGRLFDTGANQAILDAADPSDLADMLLAVENTQAALKATGATHVRVFRGLDVDKEPAEGQLFTNTRDVSAWTFDPTQAAKYGDHVIEARVPVGNVAAVFKGEKEVLIMGPTKARFYPHTSSLSLPDNPTIKKWGLGSSSGPELPSITVSQSGGANSWPFYIDEDYVAHFPADIPEDLIAGFAKLNPGAGLKKGILSNDEVSEDFIDVEAEMGFPVQWITGEGIPGPIPKKALKMTPSAPPLPTFDVPPPQSLSGFKDYAYNLYDSWGNAPSTEVGDAYLKQIMAVGLPDPNGFETFTDAVDFIDELTSIPVPPSAQPFAFVVNADTKKVFVAQDANGLEFKKIADAYPDHAISTGAFTKAEIPEIPFGPNVSKHPVPGAPSVPVPSASAGTTYTYAIIGNTAKFGNDVPESVLSQFLDANPGKKAGKFVSIPDDAVEANFGTQGVGTFTAESPLPLKPIGGVTAPGVSAAPSQTYHFYKSNLEAAPYIKFGNDVPDEVVDAYKAANPSHQVGKFTGATDTDITNDVPDNQIGTFTWPPGPPAAVPAPPSAAITSAAQKMLDSIEAGDEKWFAAKWKKVYEEAGFNENSKGSAAKTAGQIFYQYATKKAGLKYNGGAIFSNPEYLALELEFVEAVAKKDAAFLAKLENLLDKDGNPYKVPPNFVAAPSAPTSVPAAAPQSYNVGTLSTGTKVFGNDVPDSVVAAYQAHNPNLNIVKLKKVSDSGVATDYAGYSGITKFTPSPSDVAPQPTYNVATLTSGTKVFGEDVPDAVVAAYKAQNPSANVSVTHFFDADIPTKPVFKKVPIEKYTPPPGTVPAPKAPPPPPPPAVPVEPVPKFGESLESAVASAPPLTPKAITDWTLPTFRKAPQSPLINGGAHAKETFVDEFGNEWMGKPSSQGGWAAKGGAPDTAFLAVGEDAAHRILHEIGLPVAPSHIIDMGGRTYHMQKLYTNTKRQGLAGVRGADLTVTQREELIQHQVGDWLVGNHDSHELNFLILDDGHLVSIDKGQFMKFLGNDVLDTEYHPPGNFGTPYYHTFWKQYEAGEFDVDLNAIEEVLDKIEAMPDSTFEALVRPYARGRATVGKVAPGMKKFTEDQMVAAMLERKRNIRKEFDGFRAARAAKAGKRWSPPPRAEKAPAGLPGPAPGSSASGAPVPIDASFAAKLDAAGVYGRPYYVPGTGLEYGRVLFHEEFRNGKRYVVLTGQTLKEGDRVVSSVLGGVNPEAAALRAQMPALPSAPSAASFPGVSSFHELDEAGVHVKVVNAAKTLATHVNDGAYNQNTLTMLAGQKTFLEQIKAGDFPPGTPPEAAYRAQLKKAAAYYLKATDEIEAGVKSHTKLSFAVEEQKYVDPDAALKLQQAQVEWEQANANVLARREEIEQRIAKLDSSRALPPAELLPAKVWEAQVNELGKKVGVKEIPRQGGGQEYVVTTPEGVNIKYSAWDQNHSINWKGYLRLEREWDGSAESLAQMTATLDKMGLMGRPATMAEVKLTYHRALAGTARNKADEASSKIVKAEEEVIRRSREAEAAGSAFSDAQLADVWQEELERVLKRQLGNDYWKPRTTFVPNSRGRTEKVDGLWPNWYRPPGDAPVDLASHWDGHVLIHSWSDRAGPIQNAMHAIPGGIGKAERMRSGLVKDVGASEGEDLTRGGGDYLYTRIANPDSTSRSYDARFPEEMGFVLSPRAAYRLGSYIHSSDSYGALNKRVYAFTHPSTAKIKEIAKNSGNETDIRHGATLLDDVEAVIVPNEQARVATIAALKRGGLPDVIRGIPLEERVVVGAAQARAFAKNPRYQRSIYSWDGQA